MRWWRRVSALGKFEASVLALVAFIIVWSLHPNLVFSNSLLTGGDTGAHLALPAYLRATNALFHLNLTPWYPGWFAGMPAYTYYFVLPDVLATLASYVIGFAVAFKLATILGSILMPVTAYWMARLFRAPRPVPIALAVATLPFLFDASFTIDGGNLFSTMAGEYAFSFSLALALLTVGLFARGVREGRGYWVAGLSLSLTLAAHVLPWFFALGSIVLLVVFELLQRNGLGDPRSDVTPGDKARPVRFAVGAGLVSLGLSAWWLAPFVSSQGTTNSMGYTNDNVSSLHAIFTTLGWFNATGGAAGDRWVIVLAAAGFVMAFWWRDRLGMFLAALSACSLGAFILDPQGVIWNERLIPFWFISTHLLAGWLVGFSGFAWVARRRGAVAADVDVVVADEFAAETLVVIDEEGVEASSLRRTLSATTLVVLLGLASTLPGLMPAVAARLHLNTSGNQVSAWAQWNYEGYQGQTAWPEYHNLMVTMGDIGRRDGCGRAMWEYDSSENRFGTPMALMLLPYWTNNCVDSMEGLFFESSATTPYHFLNQAWLSTSPSDPQVGLNYPPLNVAAGVAHLQMLGVKYYLAFSPQAVAQANADPALHVLAVTPNYPGGVRWHIYEIANAPLVHAVTTDPVVVSSISSRLSWLHANVQWWLEASATSRLLASSGPSSWPHVTSLAQVPATPRVMLPRVVVSHVVMGLSSLRFHVSRVGVPVEVAISYFDRWHVTGARGPYRVSPNLMVVVPTSTTVTLTYGESPAVAGGNVVTDLTVLVGIAVLVAQRRRKRAAK